MKKLLLSAVFAMVALTTTFAAQLNPFAYNLYVTEDASTGYPRLHFYLNATAKKVRIYVSDGVNEYLLRNYDDGNDRPADGYATSITAQDVENLNLPIEQKLSWRVEVDGTSVIKPTQLDTYHSFYCPQGLAIDKDPNSEYFGRILMTEAMQDVPASGYKSSGKGAGIYVFNPDFTTDGVVHKGGNNFTRILAKNGYQPWRVKISDDGRIFVSSLDLNGVAVWEVSKDLNTWTPVISGTNDATDYTIKKNGNFFAGPNCSMDVIGSGERLKLLLYSCSKNAIESYNQSEYRLDEYALGTATTFTGTPKNIIKGGAFGVTHNYIDVIYDQAGGYWFGASRGGNAGQPNLVHIKADGKEDYRDESDANYGGGGVLLHNGMLFKGKKYEGGTDGKFGVYTISKNQSTGKLVLTEKYPVTSVGLKRSHNAFAVDYAENLYVVGNDGERIIAFALPYSGTVSTPAASKHSFEITKTSYDRPENHLAPFAYDLRRTIEGDGRTKLHFMLNAHARKVQVVLIDETKEDGDPTKEIILREYPNAKSEYKDFIAYHPQGYGTVITTEDVDTLGLDYGKDYSWRVDVWGKEVTSSNCVRSYDFFHPSAVDIDNNPENPNFGMILTNECQHDVKTISGYMGTGYGAGIYAFTADFKPIKNADEQYGFNGGNVFTTKRADNNSENAYAPRRIRISDDGRIFVTSLNTNGKVLWEVSSSNLNNWTEVISGNRKGTTGNDVNAVVNASGTYLGGPNIGFDVRGSDSELKLIMLSGSVNQTYYAKCHEYDLGNATQWNSSPSKTVLEGKYIINFLHSHVAYDQEGGVWFSQHRSAASDTYPSLIHINANGNEDFKEKISNRIGGGFRFNHDFSKVIIADPAGVKRTATIYTVSKDASGKPVLTEDLVVDMSLIGNNLNDFAWDYAGNLYACGNSNEKVAAYVMPRSANDKVSTPAREGEIVNLTQPVPRIVAYNLTYRPNGATKNYDFSFYANTQPTGGSISFYKNGETTPLYVYQISNLIQGDNTVSIPMATLDAELNYEKDITWELTLSAPQSQVFGRIYKSGELNTAYATINTNPATDYFGHVYAGNQQNHVSNGSGGNIYVWAPGSGTNNNQGDRYHTIKTAYTPTLSPNNKNGFTQVSAPGIAPDGKVYFTDNGKTGGVYVMDPKDYSITSFFDGLAQNEIAQYLYNSTPVGTPSSSAHIYWPGGNTAKLFLVSTEYYTKTNIGSQGSTLHRHNAGYYIYPLTEQDGRWVHNRNWGETQKVAVTEDNIYQPNFTIVGTSRGAWYCQHRRNDLDVEESRSLMFFGNDGKRKYCSTDEDEIYGSSGSAIAVNKEETLLAMASGLGGIMFFDIAWSGDIPTLTYKYTSALNNNDVVTTLNFDYNGNLVATVGDTYNDDTDKHRMVVFTMPKEGENTVTVPARFSQRVAALYADERMDVHFDKDITNESPYQTVDVFRRLQAGMCNTICLPFSLNSLENTPYKNATVFAFTGVSQGNDQVELQFSKVETIQAGVPYLIQPENDITDLLRFSPVQVNASFNNQGLSVTHDGITYHGTINPKRLEVNKNYLFLVANNRLATASAGGDMLGLRGYFTVNGEVPAKAVISFREGVTTGTTSTVTPTTDGVQKVLQNQQILIIRDGETYNILGEHINTK